MKPLQLRFLKLQVPVSGRLALTRFDLGRLKLGLNIKLLLVVIVVALVGILTSSFLLLNSLKQQFVAHMEASNTRLMLVLQAGLEHAMLTHDTEMMNSVIQQAANDLNGETIRIIDPNGVVRSSSLSQEIGTRISLTDGACQACHGSGTTQATLTKVIWSSDRSSTQTLSTVSLITNQPKCTGCHDGKINTLGVLVAQASLADFNRQLWNGFRSVALVSLFTFVLIVGLMVPALHKAVLAPISELSKGVKAIGSENLDYHIRLKSNDELGDLAAALDKMREQLKTSRAEMILRNQEIGVLYDVARITGQLLDLKQILRLVLDTVVDQLGLQAGLIYLKDNREDRFKVVVSRGFSSQQLQLIDQKRRKPGGDLTQEIAESGEVFFVPDISKDRHFDGTWDHPHRRSYINTPLKSLGKIVGTLELISRTEQPLTDRQVEILAALCNQIGIAIDNTSLFSETQRSAREALTLYQLGTQVSSSLELEQVLAAVCQGARKVLNGEISCVGLLDEEHFELVLNAISGDVHEQWMGLHIPLQENTSLAKGVPICWKEIPAHAPDVLAKLLRAEDVHSALFMPLIRSDQLHGVVAVLTKEERSFTDDEGRLLAHLAQQVVIAIENARLYQQVRYLAVLEERDRLAREMHDNLAQALGYLNLKETITGELLACGAVEQAQESLLEMKKITREAYTDTREAIFHLRNTVILGTDLEPMLNEYLAEYRAHYGLETRLVVDDASLVEFPPEVAIQLNRIIQEALTNIRKHAQATCAWVRFQRQGDQACIIIEDNGRGFDLAATQLDGKEHFGLQIMRERAESVGGNLEFDPRIGHGTRVIIHVPVKLN